VKSVDPAGPSNIGGVQAGDVIVELDGQPVPDMGALVVGARMLEPGKLATLRVWRDNQLLTVTVEVGELR
jgi:serine protease Do